MKYLAIIGLMAPSGSTAKAKVDKAEADCVIRAHLKYSEGSIALYERQGMSTTIEEFDSY